MKLLRAKDDSCLRVTKRGADTYVAFLAVGNLVIDVWLGLVFANALLQIPSQKRQRLEIGHGCMVYIIKHPMDGTVRDVVAT